jgi:arginase
LYGPIKILWIDAHLDANNRDDSPSGNIHGMPLAILSGHSPDFSWKKRISLDDVIYMGTREWDLGERRRVDKSKAKIIPVETCDHQHLSNIVADIISTC